jgi:hypothetical protein
MNDLGLHLLTQVTFLVIFVITVVQYLRHRHPARLEVALLFGILAVAILLQGVTRLTQVDLPWAELVGGLCILAHPYLFLRLAARFYPVPRWQQSLALAGLLGSGVLLLRFAPPLPTAATLVLVSTWKATPPPSSSAPP